MDIRILANEIGEFLLSALEVKAYTIYGSVADNTFDNYSDIDIEIDVSGIDNSVYVTTLSEFISTKYEVIFADYAPSLAPEKYVVSIAISSDNPFLIIDICCTSTPHCATLSKKDLVNLNNCYDHTLKLFSANLKHHIRGVDCYNDIKKMYSRIFNKNTEYTDENELLNLVYIWLKNNAESRHMTYVNSFSSYLNV